MILADVYKENWMWLNFFKDLAELYMSTGYFECSWIVYKLYSYSWTVYKGII